MRADLARQLLQACPQPLARQLHQPELADPAHLDARPIGLQRIAQPLLDRPLMPPFGHVDEVDHDQPGEVAQPQLPGNLVRRLEIGLYRGLVDVTLTRRPARIDVDRRQRLGGVDHDRPARVQLHGRAVHLVELVLDLVGEEERRLLAILLHEPGPARHQHRHQTLGGAVALVALDQHFLDVACVEIAHRAFDEVAFLVDHLRRHAFQRGVADLIPQPQQILVVALDLRLAPLLPGGADDQAHARPGPRAPARSP